MRASLLRYVLFWIVWLLGFPANSSQNRWQLETSYMIYMSIIWKKKSVPLSDRQTGRKLPRISWLTRTCDQHGQPAQLITINFLRISASGLFWVGSRRGPYNSTGGCHANSGLFAQPIQTQVLTGRGCHLELFANSFDLRDICHQVLQNPHQFRRKCCFCSCHIKASEEF